MTSPLHESRLLWIHDPHPNQPPRVTPRQTVIKENRDSVPRNNNPTVPRNNQQTVPRNNNVENNNNARAPLDIIPSASWFNLTSRLLVFPLLVLVSVTQCPGLICRITRERPKCIMPQIALLLPLREKGIVSTEGRGVREKEKVKMRHLFMMRAGPISAQ